MAHQLINLHSTDKEKLDADVHRFFHLVEPTSENLLYALSINGFLLEKIPKTLRTHEFCFQAVNQCGRSLQFVPESIKSKELCLSAIKQTSMALKYVPEHLLTEEVCLFAVKHFNERIFRYSEEVRFSSQPIFHHSFMELIPETLFTEQVKCEALLKGLYTDRLFQLTSLDLCTKLLRENGLALQFVPKKYRTKELCILAIENNPIALAYTPNTLKTKKVCLEALARDYKCIEYIPSKHLSDAICENIILTDALALKYIPNDFLDKKLCALAVSQNPDALEFVPPTLKTRTLCLNALNKNWRTFVFFPKKHITIETVTLLLKKAINTLYNSNEILTSDHDLLIYLSSTFSKHINNIPEIISLQRKLRVRYFVEKGYDLHTNLLYTKECILYQNYDTETAFGYRRYNDITSINETYDLKEFNEFNEFYSYVNNDLTDANLLLYPFEDVNLNHYNIHGALISSDILMKHHLYDNAFYNKTISSDFYTLKLSELNEDIPSTVVSHQHSLSDNSLNDTDVKFYYVSDLHLNHKLLDKFSTKATEHEIVHYLETVVNQLVSDAEEKKGRDYLLIHGDISFNFEVSKIFYQLLCKKWSPSKIIVVLGNHELWDFNSEIKVFNRDTLGDIIKKYRDLFCQLNITFLHNEILFISANGNIILNESQILTMTQSELEYLDSYTKFCVLGGLGFSGYSNDYNADNGLYRETVPSREQDMVETQKFKHLYDNIKKCLPTSKVIVLTHTPKENWSTDDYNSNWVYVNGHTHRNTFTLNTTKTVYSDNQIGYKNSSFGLKFFKLSNYCDIFKYYANGIHPISRGQYLEYNRCKRINMTFNRSGGTIMMLKRSGIYCFIYQNKNGLCLLNGGALKKLTNPDISYYYDNMDAYANVIKHMLKDYNAALKQLSDEIKQIGGEGNIHGCIVDIDFSNHIFLDPINGTITAYSAHSITNKLVYPSVLSLLKKERQDLYLNFSNNIRLQSNKATLIVKDVLDIDLDFVRLVTDTSMYKDSNTMKSLQYLTELNVIRSWNDNVIKKSKTLSKTTSQLV